MRPEGMDPNGVDWRDLCLAREMARRPSLAARIKRKRPAAYIQRLRDLLEEYGRG